MLETLTNQVEKTLCIYPSTRNSDIDLTIRLWSTYYSDLLIKDHSSGVISIPLRTLWDLPSQDNIKRIRAKIQNEEHRYLPTDPKIFIERARLSLEWKKALGYNTTWGDKEWEIAVTEWVKAKQEPLF